MATILQQPDGNISFDILLNGTKIKDAIEVQEIWIEMEVNRIASARVVIQDGGAIGVESAPFENSEGSDFVPGTEIEIKLGYEDERESVFKGIIVTQRLTVKSGNSSLEIMCKDKAVNLTKGRFNAIFQDQKDSDAITSIIGNYGLASTVDATTVTHPLIMQYNCSDWDFIVIRAEMNNMSVLTYRNEITIRTRRFLKLN